MNMFRTLTAREIECRAQQIKENGLVLLLYKDARCDQNILDETVGAMGWKRSHSRDNANCIVSLWDESKREWISKEDTGTESNTEAQKGLASDSFKRACVNWGIGRELYTAPFIWVSSDKFKIESKKNRAGDTIYYTYDKFEVADIAYNEHREITSLTIINAKTKAVVFSMNGAPAKPTETPKPPETPAQPPQQEAPKEILFKCEECGEVLKPYIGKDNKEVSVRKHAMCSAAKFGKTLCIDCINKKQAGENA